jgi:hypothetical protein
MAVPKGRRQRRSTAKRTEPATTTAALLISRGSRCGSTGTGARGGCTGPGSRPGGSRQLCSRRSASLGNEQMDLRPSHRSYECLQFSRLKGLIQAMSLVRQHVCQQQTVLIVLAVDAHGVQQEDELRHASAPHLLQLQTAEGAGAAVARRDVLQETVLEAQSVAERRPHTVERASVGEGKTEKEDQLVMCTMSSG